MTMDIPHELREEFPQEISLIERIIRTNYEFRRLAERYDEVNRNIYRIESGEEPTTDEVLARLKKWRLKLKDEIAAILTKLEHRMSSSNHCGVLIPSRSRVASHQPWGRAVSRER